MKKPAKKQPPKAPRTLPEHELAAATGGGGSPPPAPAPDVFGRTL